jgi:hypothetical protein
MEWRHLTEVKQDQYFGRMAKNRNLVNHKKIKEKKAE